MKNSKTVVKLKFVGVSLFVIVSTLLFSCSKNLNETPAQQSAEQTIAKGSPSSARSSTVAVPFENTLFVSCANGGAGEDVAMTGKTNFVYHIEWNDHGFSMVYHDNTREIKGVGAITGDNFVGSGGTQGNVSGSWESGQWVGTTISRLKIEGNNSSYTFNYHYHITITPDGDVTVKILNQSVTCD
ncbi:MAG TPA: hypothetical protein VGG71_05630 [Chitinophagaceae bacterium]